MKEQKEWGKPIIEIEGNRQVVLSGRCRIALYSPCDMRIRCDELVICIAGNGLELQTLDSNELAIRGTISEVGFLTEG